MLAVALTIFPINLLYFDITPKRNFKMDKLKSGIEPGLPLFLGNILAVSYETAR